MKYTNEEEFQKLQEQLFAVKTKDEACSILWQMKPLIEHASRSALKTRLKKLLWSHLLTWPQLYEQAEEMTEIFMTHLLKRWQKHSTKRVLDLGNYMYYYIIITNTESRKLERTMTEYVYDTQERAYYMDEDAILDRIEMENSISK